MTRKKSILYAVRLISLILTSFYLPLVCVLVLAALFTFSYLSLLPLNYKLMVLAVVVFFTIAMPMFFIITHLAMRMEKWTARELGQKHLRMVPYVISLAGYGSCVWVLQSVNVFHFILSIVIATMLVQAVCTVVNIWWKISTHTAAIGGIAGALVAFAEILGFNPVWWLCTILIIAGILGSASMIVRQHSLPQVVAGFATGFLCAAIGIMVF
jgi:hypothetical protein